MRKIKKIKSFIISRPQVRFIILFFYNKVFPYLKYSFYFLIAALVIWTIYLAIFNKTRLEQIKYRLTNRVYRAVNFNKGYSEIKISGYKRTSYDEVASIAREQLIEDDGNDNQLIIQALKSKIEKLPWVEQVVISISLQGTVNIKIKEHQPFAIWEEGGKYIISKTGKIIPYPENETFDNLVILTGNNAYKNVKSLFNILAIDPDISKNIYSATWVGGRRWDVRFVNGLLVKLPSGNSDNDMSSAWDSLIKLYNTPGSLIGLKEVDLRIAKKIYLEYDEGSTKELLKSPPK